MGRVSSRQLASCSSHARREVVYVTYFTVVDFFSGSHRPTGKSSRLPARWRSGFCTSHGPLRHGHHTAVRDCISRTRAPCPRAGIVVATSELVTREQERYKTLRKVADHRPVTTDHEVARFVSSGNGQTVCGRATRPEWQLRRA